MLTVLSIILLVVLAGCAKSEKDTYEAGVYTASKQGYKGEIKVEVEFTENEIISVKILEQNETGELGTKVEEQLSESILEQQNSDVDAVTGATVTSTAFKEAVADCIKQAAAE